MNEYPDMTPVHLPAGWQRPRVVVRADLLNSVSIGFLLLLLGPVLGWVWSLLAPPVRAQVVSGQSLLSSPDESYHHFDALAIFMLLCLVAGLLVGAALWLLRRRRGPVLMLAAAVGVTGASVLARWVGESLAATQQSLPRRVSIGEVLVQAPTVGTWWVLLVAPFGVALAYGTLAAWSGRYDLDRA